MELYAIILIVAVVAFAVLRALLSYFTCPNCGTKFKVNPIKYIIAPHSLNKRLVKCPNCGHKEMLASKWGKE